MVKQKEKTSFRIFPAPGGYGFIVAGEKGLKRSGLPRKKKSTARAIIKEEFPDAKEDAALLPDLIDSLLNFYQGDKVQWRVTLDMCDLTPFSAAVYGRLQGIRRGTTVTYGELAELAGSPKAARGVGVAMRKNPFPPIVP
ncbi:MAG: methylated-DNA-[protein]-cysteine S-methyltransferase [Planctomycetota bacterium]|jgi:methylated-DNA-[protein]-cysteine S-methyltransferase